MTSRASSSSHYQAASAGRGSGNGFVGAGQPRSRGQYARSTAASASGSRFERVSGSGYVQAGYGRGNGHGGGRAGSSRGGSNGGSRTKLILIAVLVALIAGGILFWTHRPVEITVNGSRTSLTCGTALTEVKSRQNVSTKAGNLVSITGKVLKQGAGDEYSVTVNGTQLSTDDAKKYAVSGGEDISFGDGGDITEDYTTAVVETQPKLTMDGSYGAIAYISQWGKVGKKEVRTGSVSGETADGDTIQQGQDCVVKLVNIKPQGDQKLVALTFDDGPSSYTAKYLDILKQHGAVGTFFNLGSAVDSSPAEAKAIVDAGSQLASHTYSHDQLTKDSSDKVLSEVTSAFTSIKNATGATTSVIRPPYGDFKQTTWLATGGNVTVSVLWNMDSEDWRIPGVDKIVSNATTGIQSGYIILMHDGGGKRDEDVDALPKIIDNLHNEGYTFVTLADLMRSAGDIPEDICSGTATMPSDAVWPTEIG